MVIAVVNQKGGVGKTTATLNLGSALAEAGRRVLLIDLDTQHDLSSFDSGLLSGGVALRIVQADAESLRALLEEALGGGRDAPGDGRPEFVLIDCPPALGDEVAEALRVADVALVPLQAEFLAMRGLRRMQETIEFARDPRRQGNASLQVRILLTMTDRRDPISAQIAEDVARRFPELVLPVIIKRSPLFASSALARESILQHSPRSHGAASFRALAAEILRLAPDSASGSAAAPTPATRPGQPAPPKDPRSSKTGRSRR